MVYKLFEALDKKFNFAQTKAHCDIPCGIYDPIIPQIAALTVVRMLDLMADLEKTATERNAAFFNSVSRYVAVKEEHAEKAKHEVRIIWGDYLKAQHLEKHPDAHDVVHKIMQLGSKVRQTADRQAGLEFVEAINQFARIFWETKGVATKQAKAPYNPALDMVYPNL